MAINYFSGVVGAIKQSARQESDVGESRIIFGTVTSIDPLSIELEMGDILPSNCFYPLDSVLTKKVRMIVHRAYGTPQEIQFNGTANEISNQMNALLFNLSGSTPNFNLQFNTPDWGTTGGAVFTNTPAPETYGIAGNNNFNRWLTMVNGQFLIDMPNLSSIQTMENISKIFSAKNNIAFKIEFIEASGNQPEQNKNIQNQTTAIEGIIWQGMRAGDSVLMTSHNHNQKFLIHQIINRDRGIDDYEQANIWDSRINNIENVRNMRRVPTKLPPKPFI